MKNPWISTLGGGGGALFAHASLAHRDLTDFRVASVAASGDHELVHDLAVGTRCARLRATSAAGFHSPNPSTPNDSRGETFIPDPLLHGVNPMSATASATGLIHRYRSTVDAYHSWLPQSSLYSKAALALLFAGLMGLLAQVRIPLPFTPVPITGQVFGVLLCAALLGARWGTASQATYVGLGVAGVPWFTGMNAGFAYATGATMGYLAGFVVATALLGATLERFPQARTFGGLVLLMLAAVAVIHALGVAWLMVLLGIGLNHAFLLGSAPFLALDAGKAVAAAGLGLLVVRSA